VPIDDLFSPKGSEVALVQNRLNIAALSLTALVFSGSFSLSLFGAIRSNLRQEVDYRAAFGQVEAPLAMGVIVSLASIGSFLLCQQIKDASNPRWGRWGSSRQWWFSVGQVLLYLALSQAMSASLTEVVFGVSLVSEISGQLIGLLAMPVWLFLLVFGPVTYIMQTREIFNKSGLWALVSVYLSTLIMILGINAEIYRVQSGEPDNISAFVINFIEQLYQPLTWHQPWPGDR
jgi:hypothetical protein